MSEESPLPTSVWAGHDKHIFVISEAGKPIYSLHGEEDHLVSLGGIMMAMVSFVADSGDAIRSIRAGKTTIVFLVKAPLILVGVSQGPLSSGQLTVQLSYIHSQIVSTLTLAQLTRSLGGVSHLLLPLLPGYSLRGGITTSGRCSRARSG